MTADVKKSRVEESRSMQSRDVEHHKVVQHITNQYKGRFDMDPETIPSNKQYFWARDALLGQPDMNRLIELRRKGFNPVPAERHPERHMGDLPWRRNHMDDYIYDGGLILVERDKVYQEMEEKIKNEETLRLMTSTPGQDHLMNEPTMPMKNYGSEIGISKRASFQGE